MRSQRDSLTLAVIFMSPEVVSWIGHWFTGSWYVVLSVSVHEIESLSLQVLGASSIGVWCFQTWNLYRNLRWRLNPFRTRSLQRILGSCWLDFVSNKWLLRKTQMRFVTSIVRERELWLYGHVARFPDADPAHQILSPREPREWRKSMGKPHSSWLQQVDWHIREMGQVGRKWTQRSAAPVLAPIPDLNGFG